MMDAHESRPATRARHAPTYAHLFLAGLIALVGGAIIGSVADDGNDRSEFSPPDKNEVVATLQWGSPTDVEIKFIWMNTPATRGGGDSIFGSSAGYYESETLTLAKATITNVLTGVDFQTRAQDPAAFDAQHKIAAYYAMIELIDDNVGRMLAALERTGQADNTLVIFTSDHGEMLGDHGLLLKGCRFYEGLVHVPLILRWPGQILAGATTDALVELTDLTPLCWTPPAPKCPATWPAARWCPCCAAPPPSIPTPCAASTTRP